MKDFYLLVLSLVLCGCGNLMLNAAFQNLGVYEDRAELVKTTNSSKEIVFIPMKHLGTPVFYSNVKKKVDSLTSKGFFFYAEGVKSDASDDIGFRKFRKITGQPTSKHGYKYLLDSVVGKEFKVKLKKEIIDQPTYHALGVDSLNVENVDASLTQIINYYEGKYGEILLQDCDFVNDATEKTTCKDKKVKKEIKDDLMTHFRNEIVLKEIDIETRNKIVIIYGEAHIPGIIEGLKERGYQLVDAPSE